MNRLAGASLLVLLGLGVGLWLGFDPQARAMVQEEAAKASDSFAHVRTDISTQVTAIISAKSGPEAPAGPDQPSSPRVSLNLDAQNLWDGARQLWLSFVSRFQLKS